MCFFDRYRYPCGHIYWGRTKYPCEAALLAKEEKEKKDREEEAEEEEDEENSHEPTCTADEVCDFCRGEQYSLPRDSLLSEMEVKDQGYLTCNTAKGTRFEWDGATNKMILPAKRTTRATIRLKSNNAIGEEFHCKVVRVRNYIRCTDDQRCSKCEETFSAWSTRNYGEMFEQAKSASTPYLREVLPDEAPKSPPEDPCYFEGCLLESAHPLPHVVSYSPCPADGCFLPDGHSSAHGTSLLSTSRGTVARRTEEIRRIQHERLFTLTALVLHAMGNAFFTAQSEPEPEPYLLESTSDVTEQLPVTNSTKNLAAPTKAPVVDRHVPTATWPYQKLDLHRQEIRLFELFPKINGKKVEGAFRYAVLSDDPSYTALSYTWGDPTDIKSITLRGTGNFKVRGNLYEFLRQQSSIITQPKLFWIDALCINQSNVHERNHQVNLMKDIYEGATDVYIWLGPESADSDIAMDYIRKKGVRQLRTRGPGFFRIWTNDQGKALRDLCDRPYWRRMWVIQEVIYAHKITVWCGAKSFEWEDVERLYLKLKALEDTHWFAHHAFVIEVLQSSAAVMVWQRAHWRHPDTPIPSLRTLIEVFRQWQCADIRDKVFALVNMASAETTLLPDYALSARDLYFAILKRLPDEGENFANMLSQVLGLSGRDLGYNFDRNLIEYKVHSADSLVLKRRLDDYW